MKTGREQGQAGVKSKCWPPSPQTTFAAGWIEKGVSMQNSCRGLGETLTVASVNFNKGLGCQALGGGAHEAGIPG